MCKENAIGFGMHVVIRYAGFEDFKLSLAQVHIVFSDLRLAISKQTHLNSNFQKTSHSQWLYRIVLALC